MKTSSFLSPFLFFCLLAPAAFAGSATWQLDPVDSDWNTAANWNPATVPNGSSDIATFDLSNQPSLTLSADTEVSGMVFNAGASSYGITVSASRTLTLDGGITNNSAVPQDFVIDKGSLIFHGGNDGLLTNYTLNSAGSSVAFTSGVAQYGTYTVLGGGQILFSGFAAAAFGSTYTLEGNGDAVAGLLQLSGNASTSSALINLNGDSTAGTNCTFLDSAHAFFTTFNVNGADSVDHLPGVLTFAGESSESTNVMIANAGSNGGAGGKIIYMDSAGSDGSAIEVYGNGSLDVSGNDSDLFVGSLAGDGSIFLGSNTLDCANGSNSTFDGSIQDGGLRGGTGASLLKRDRGLLTLTGASTYAGGTTVTRQGLNRIGALRVLNTAGSATGSGPVAVDYGTLGGSGTIRGAVTIGLGSSGTNGFIAPALGGNKALALTIQSTLTFKSDSGYNWLIQSKGQKARADRVNAGGVTIESGAQFNFVADQLQSTLRMGTTFTVINGTAATAISGTFANLADGAVVNVNGNNFQANYEGGTGNDLTLTVVP